MNADQIDEAAVQTLREMVAIGPELARRIVARLRHAGLFRKADPDQETCKHIKRQGVCSAGSDGSSSFTGHCSDCGKDLSYKIEAGSPLGSAFDLSMLPRN